jgi:hypothetical protein
MDGDAEAIAGGDGADDDNDNNDARGGRRKKEQRVPEVTSKAKKRISIETNLS